MNTMKNKINEKIIEILEKKTKSINYLDECDHIKTDSFHDIANEIFMLFSHTLNESQTIRDNESAKEICGCGTEKYSLPNAVNGVWICGKCSKPY